MNRNNIKGAFAHIKTEAGNDEKLQHRILERIKPSAMPGVPIEGLKKLCGYFLVYLLVAFILNFVVVALLPSLPPAEITELAEQEKIMQIAAGFELFNNSERLINLLVEGCFKLFFKISFLAFIFAAALVKADNSETSETSGKGEKLCAD